SAPGEFVASASSGAGTTTRAICPYHARQINGERAEIRECPIPPRSSEGNETRRALRAEALPPDRLVGERGAQEIVEPGQGRENEQAFEDMRDRLAEGEQAADRPAGRRPGADEFGADQNG